MDILLSKNVLVLLVPFSCCYVQDHVVSANDRSGRSCRWNQITILRPKGTECFDCPECPLGHGLVPQCGSRVTAHVRVECVRCQRGEGYSDKHDISSCKPCTICDPNEEAISPCTATKNAVCGKCKNGYYRAESGDCHPCSWCCNDSKEGDIEKQCSDQTNLPVNQVCRYDVNTIKCAPLNKNTTAQTHSTSAVTIRVGSEGDVIYHMGGKKRSNINSLFTVCGLVALAVWVLIGLLYICHRKNNRLFHLPWVTKLHVNTSPTMVESTYQPLSQIVFGRKETHMV